MFERIGWFVEILNVILCLHFLYGKKIKSKAATGILVAADMFVMEVVSTYNASRISIGIIYVMIWIYILTEFEHDIKKSLLAMMIIFIAMGLFQLIACIPWLVVGMKSFNAGIVALVQIEVSGLLYILRKKFEKLFKFILLKNSFILIITIGFTAYMVFQIVRFKVNHDIEAELFLPIVIFGTIICILVYYWQLEKEKREQKELEMQINNLCESSFRELIETIRRKQHDFHNHIHTLQCQHYTIHTYEELVAEQEKYCADIKYDNRFYKLLTSKSPVISGFLYGKFMNADKKGIDIEYSVVLNRALQNVPEYIIVEMVGILWDNAEEYVLAHECKKICIHIEERVDDSDVNMHIALENPIYNISYNDITAFFQEGYSEKKEHAGLGLDKIRRYVEQYQMNLRTEKLKKNGTEWLKIEIGMKETVNSAC